MKLRSLGAWAVAGVALWFSMGVLDVAGGPAGPVRVAMLPPAVGLAAAIALAVLAGLIVERRWPDRRRRDVALPLYSLSILALPYLPWLPDALPVLRVFAGPGRYLVWLVVCAQVVWAAMGTGRGARLAVRVRSWTPGRTFLAVGLVSVAVYGAAAVRLVSTDLYPGGDEPHYLVLAQSIWLDGDLDIENNHARRDYAAYLGTASLEPHSLARGVDGAQYSVHPIGLPLMVAPILAVLGYPGVVLLLVIVATLVSALAWIWLRHLTGSVAAATFGWAVVALSLPVVCGSGLVYPEMPAALLVTLAFAVGLREPDPLGSAAPRPIRLPALRPLVVGLAAAGLPWLSSKFAPLSAVLIVIGVVRAAAAGAGTTGRGRALAGLLGPYTVSLVGWFTFFIVFWGSPWPSAAYGGADQTQMALANWQRGLPGIFFDQEYGVLAYAPAVALAAVGLWSMWQAGGRARRTGIEVAAAVAALVLTVTGHAMWWGGSSVPGRFTLPILPVLALPVAWAFRMAAPLADRRAVYRLLLLAGMAATTTALVVPDGAILALRRDGISRLLQWLSPDWHLWAFAPDFIMQSPWWGLAQVGVGAAAVALAFVVFQVRLGRARGVAVSRVGRGAAFLRANLSATVAALIVTLLTPPVMRAALKPDVEPEGRARIGMLESYDPSARPMGIVYDPLSRVAADDVPRRFVLSARPGSRRAPQPTPVLFNARFALPAGRYRVELEGAAGVPLAGRLALQGGRQSGGALDTWNVNGEPGRPWQAAFDVPVDLSFVGFRASADLPPAVSEMRIRPEHVTPTLDRTAAYDVLASAVFGDRFVFLFHDGAAYPEGTGFWVRGSAETHVTVVSPAGRLTQPVRLKVRNGPVPNTIDVATPETRQQVDLQPGEVQEITVAPTALDGTLRLIVGARAGFVPADVEPGNADRRLLAVWVEVVG